MLYGPNQVQYLIIAHASFPRSSFRLFAIFDSIRSAIKYAAALKGS